MTRLYVVVEGQTEEAFVNDVLGPAMWPLGVYPSARLIGRAGHRGGHVTFARVRADVSLLLKHDTGAFVTTMIDYYGLGAGFPPVVPTLSAAQNVVALETAIKGELLSALPASSRVDVRFLPYLQLHEFEALLFSDPTAFAGGIYRDELAPALAAIRGAFATPEDINDDRLTAPSKRIHRVCPDYGRNKPLFGTLAALAVGLPAMRRECPHFRQWIERLSALPAATP